MKSNKDTEIIAQETESPETEEQDVVEFEISYYPADITLKGYQDKYESDTILVPDFQRRYVWTQIQAGKLIESFLLGLPVPGVFLYQERKSKKLQIVDGQQRILSIVYFLKGMFNEKKFRLTGVQPKWEGKSFEDLDEPYQLQLQDSVLRSIIIQQLEPNDDSSIYHIFERLNTGGTNLTPMEIRKCVYYGKFFEMLENCNKNINWRKILGQEATDKRLRDVEFILRIFALRDRWTNYKKPMKGFLNEYMCAMNKKQDCNLKLIEDKFCDTCAYIIQQCGEKPFHLKGRLNYAVMDSVLVAAFHALKNKINDFEKRFESLKNDEDYLNLVSMNTSDEVTLKDRFKKCAKVLNE